MNDVENEADVDVMIHGHYVVDGVNCFITTYMRKYKLEAPANDGEYGPEDAA